MLVSSGDVQYQYWPPPVKESKRGIGARVAEGHRCEDRVPTASTYHRCFPEADCPPWCPRQPPSQKCAAKALAEPRRAQKNAWGGAWQGPGHRRWNVRGCGGDAAVIRRVGYAHPLHGPSADKPDLGLPHGAACRSALTESLTAVRRVRAPCIGMSSGDRFTSRHTSGPGTD